VRKVEFYERIRRDQTQRGWGIRRLAREHRCHRRDVRQALADACPPARKVVTRVRPALGPWETTIEAILEADQKVPRKQRHTARRIWKRLVAEHGAGVAETTVRAYVRRRRREKFRVLEAMVPQYHEPGQEAEVDFSEALVHFHGCDEPEKVYFFHMRACCSGAVFHWPVRALTQEAFLEAHVQAFREFCGVFPVIRYDNLTLAVRKVLRGRSRKETDAFTRLRSHYQFTAEFCLPGIKGAHEKGGVEGEVGYFRRNHLVPIPQAGNWGHLIDICQFAAMEELERHLDGRVESVGEAWAKERGLLRPLPTAHYDTRTRMPAGVDPKGRIKVLRNHYSVPIPLRGLEVEVAVSSREVTAFHQGKQVSCHERLYGIGGDRLELDHYLEVLRYKPRALAGSVPLRQAIADGSFQQPYIDFFRQLRDRHGESEGARQMVDVLFLHRDHGAPAVLVALEEALSAGSVNFAAVALNLRRATEQHTPPASVPELHIVSNPAVPVPDCTHYDQLLNKRDD
jgi:hypothetical protein